MTSHEKKGTKRLAVKVHILPIYAQEVKPAPVQKAARAAFKAAGTPPGGALTVLVTDDAQIQELNRSYRGLDAPTDVLAFSEADGAEGFIPPPGETQYWGDIIISCPRAMEQGAAYGHPWPEELALLVVHGTLHLLGYDHEQASARERMWAVQNAALAQLGIHWQP